MGIRVNWVKYLKLSKGDDISKDTCLFGDYVAVGGDADFLLSLSPVKLRGWSSLVLLDRNTGEVLKTWREKMDAGFFRSCLSVDGKLYVVFDEKIYIFDSKLQILKKVEVSTNHLRFQSIDFDGNYLYVAGCGFVFNLDLSLWYVEKRTLDLELVKSKKLSMGNYPEEWIRKIRVNPTTNELWAVGHFVNSENDEKEEHHLIVIFDKELNEVKRVEYPEDHEAYLSDLYDICFDDAGNAYAAGEEGIAKLDKHGNLIAVNKSIRTTQTTCIGNFIYAFGESEVDGYDRHILYVLDSELNIVEKQVLSRSVNAASQFPFGRPSYDGRNIYVAGYDEAFGEGKRRWVIYSVLLPTETVAPARAIAPTVVPITRRRRRRSKRRGEETISYDEIIPLLTLPLSNLISGYGCEPSKEVEIYGNKYRCCKLGSGGWGSVYLCERRDERIVVKMPFYAEALFLGYERLTEYSGLIDQQHELEVLKSLSHPNILKLLDVKGPFLFYEYADYGSLAWQLANGYKPSLNDVLLLTLQISDALRYVHSRGMMHGDIKPSNILLVGGVSKLADFSSAKLVAKDKSLSITSTYGYRAPEQADKELRKKAKELGLENRVDIYQLGSTLLHALTGEPLDGEEASEEEADKRTKDLDERISVLLREMLSINPAKRPSAEKIVEKAYTLLKKAAS